MYTTKTALSVAALAANRTTDPRYALDCVHVEPDGLCVATDGQILLTVAASHPVPDTDLPPQLLNGCTTPREIPTAAIKAIKAIKGSRTLPQVTETVGVAETSVTVLDGNLQPTTVATTKGDDTRAFPDWRRVLPDDDETTVLYLDPAYLQMLGAAGKALGATTLQLRIPSAEYADPRNVATSPRYVQKAITILVEAGATSDHTLHAVLMPMRPGR